jgi:hypothetical protein
VTIALTQAETHELEAKREAYLISLSEQFADNYGKWLSQQTQEKQNKIRKKAAWVKHGMATVAPLTCKGPKKCPFFANCPIPDDTKSPGLDSDYPINDPCVLEVEYVAQKVFDYLTELNVDPTNVVEKSLIDELALLDLLRNRAVMVLSNGDNQGQGRDLMLTEEVIAHVDDQGNEYINKTTKAHPAIDIMDKHERRRQKILEKFMATRESKFKLYGGNLENNSKLLADLQTLRGFIQSVVNQGVTIEPKQLEDFDEKIK